MTPEIAAQEAPDTPDLLGELHSVAVPVTSPVPGAFTGLVVDEVTREFLVPTYPSLAGHLLEAEQAVAEAGGMPDGSNLSAPRNFRPYPIRETSIYASRVIAILDSGVRSDHPLLHGRLHDVVDFTNEGVDDTCGHGTVQALRHALFEPRAQFLILKVAGRSCRPTLGTILSALEYLRSRKDVGGVYFAGGINTDEYEAAQIACHLADELVRENDLRNKFFATIGNTDRSAKWCPAAAEEVVGVQVVDLETYAKPTGAAGGFAVPQIGTNTSFPDVTPMRIPEFYAEYTRVFLYSQLESLRFMEPFARRALEYEESMEDAVRLLAKISVQQGDGSRAAGILEDALRRRPGSATLTAELAVVYATIGRTGEAGPLYDRAFRMLTVDDTVKGDERFRANLLFEHGLYLEVIGEDAARVMEQLVRAAELDPARIGALSAYGGRRFYRDACDDTIDVNYHVLRLDPTFAPAWHNIAISHALAGRTRDALHALDQASTMRDTFNSGSEMADLGHLRNTIMHGSSVERQVRLRYVFANGREHAAELVDIRRLLAGSTEDAELALQRSGTQKLEAIARSAVMWSEQLLEEGPSEFLAEVVALMGTLGAVLEPGGTLRLRAEVSRQVGKLYRRLGEYDEAESWFRTEAELLRTVSVRERETALLHAALCALAAGYWERSSALLGEAMQTSFEIAEAPEVGPYTTAMVSELMAAQAWVAMMEGDFREADRLAYSAYIKDKESSFNLLTMAAVRIRTDQEIDADHALANVLNGARNSGAELARVFGMLYDYPFLNVTYRNGETAFSVLRTRERALLSRAVELVPTARFDLSLVVDRRTGRWRYPFGQCRARAPEERAGVTAVLGTGLVGEHPCLAGRIVDSVDITGGGLEDENGATTVLALATVAADTTVGALRNIRVLDGSGYGSVEALIEGFAEIIGSDTAMVLTHLETSFEDSHLRGLVVRAGLKTRIVTAAPSENGGRVFPYSVAGDVVIVSQ
ncbi:MAG: hypothetical protein OXH09_15800 [Gammaproteobacteria bacterium]|nr:hypothetical protein [Gammaproteobacteria bacterium]